MGNRTTAASAHEVTAVEPVIRRQPALLCQQQLAEVEDVLTADDTDN